MKRGLLWLMLAGLLAGCGTPSIYSWGQYESLVYTTFAEPGKAPPERQIEKLEEDLQKARSRNQPVPPGFHAYLGYLYVQTGKLDAAKQELETEKALFPESAVFMDRLLANLQPK
jgi:hypothetical protein